MEPQRQFWKVRHRNRFLLTIMKELAGNAHISFEGDQKVLGLAAIQGATQVEDSVLKRNTLLPRQEFVSVPLEPSTLSPIFSKIGGTIPKSVRHILIEKNGQLEFAAYDNFHPECIFFGDAVSNAFLDVLISEGVLKRLDS
ncbi:MAG: hypothetical protein ABSE87_12745 [Terracidiphilus sp.]|jgi:hypothetical protein